MKRRNFLQWALGALGIGAVGVPKTKVKTEPNWPPYEGMISEGWNPPNYTNFPEQIMSIKQFRGRMFVACEYSIWEVEDNGEKYGFQKKLIKILNSPVMGVDIIHDRFLVFTKNSIWTFERERDEFIKYA